MHFRLKQKPLVLDLESTNENLVIYSFATLVSSLDLWGIQHAHAEDHRNSSRYALICFENASCLLRTMQVEELLPSNGPPASPGLFMSGRWVVSLGRSLGVRASSIRKGAPQRTPGGSIRAELRVEDMAPCV